MVCFTQTTHLQMFKRLSSTYFTWSVLEYTDSYHLREIVKPRGKKMDLAFLAAEILYEKLGRKHLPKLCKINLFLSNVPFQYPLKTSGKKVFLTLSGGIEMEHWDNDLIKTPSHNNF